MILVWLLLFFIILLLLSIFFSCIETALTSQTKLSLKHLVESKGISDQKFKSWLENPSRLLSTILIGNNSINNLISVLTTIGAIMAAEYYGLNKEMVVLVVTIGTTLSVIMFGEIIPKIFAKQNSAKVAVALIGPLEQMARVLSPLTKILLWFSNGFIRMLGGATSKEVPFLTMEEILHLINAGGREGLIREDEQRMIYSVFKFKKTHVREVMVPRREMVCLNMQFSRKQLVDQVIRAGYSRFPVYKDSMDPIVGMLYTKDLLNLLNHKELIIIQDILRPPFLVSENTKISELLKEFKEGKRHMAIVVDAAGTTSGLITLEDLIEEIMGEIDDEYDVVGE